MKFALALIALTALTVSAHWTHDESLAREIGPPPGEEDVEVASLEGHEELLQTKTGSTKTYRITFGTVYTNGELRASMSNFKVALKGAKPAAPEAGKATAWNDDTTWQTNADNQIRYYQGSFMTYEKAKKGAPDLHPGMTPLIDQNTVGCSAKVKGKSQVCSAAKAKQLAPCEPLAKDCEQAITKGEVTWALGATTLMKNEPGEEEEEEEEEELGESEDPIDGLNGGFKAGMMGADGAPEPTPLGPIQRGQFKLADVGKIIGVQISEITSFGASDPCYKEATGFKEAACSSPWSPAFVKINTNDPQTGVGDGVYYIAPCAPENLRIGSYVIPATANSAAEQKKDQKLTAGTSLTGECTGNNNAVLTKCAAQTCEEQMDTKLGLMDKERYEFAEI